MIRPILSINADRAGETPDCETKRVEKLWQSCINKATSHILCLRRLANHTG
jgi:hypothetical protein